MSDDESSAANTSAGATRASSRVRKPVEHFKPAEPEKKEVEPLAIPAGSGERLGDIPNVERRLAMTNGNAAELKKLHRIMFPGGRPLKATIKKQIRQFRGWEVPADEASFQREKLKQLVELDGKAVLKPLCQLLDVEISGTKASMAERIYSFLCKPSSSGKAFRTKKPATSSSAASGTKKRKVASESGSTRGPTAYFLFQNSVRPEIREQNPGIPVTEIAKLVGAQWHRLSPEEKEKWKAKAAELKPDAGEGPAKKKLKVAARSKNAAAKKPAAAKKGKKAESEEEGTDDEEAEDAEEEDEAREILKERLTTAIKAEMQGKDLETFKLKDLTRSLEGEFGADLIKANKELIKDIVQSLM